MSTSTSITVATNDLDAIAKPRGSSWGLSSAVCLLGGIAVFMPLIDGGTTHVPVLLFRLTILAVICTWIVRKMKQGSIDLPHAPIYLLITLFSGWAGVTLLWAPYKAAGEQWVITLLMYGAFFHIVLQGLRSRQEIKHVFTAVLAVGLFEGIIGSIQYVIGSEARPRGTFFNPNFFASYEVAILAIAIGLLSVSPEGNNPGKRWERVLLWSTAAVSCSAILVAQSRGAALALISALAFIALYRFRKTGLLILILTLVIGVMAPTPLKQRFIEAPAQDPYAYTRFEMWEDALQRVADHPFGVGLGMYKYTSFQYRFPTDQGVLRYGKRAESAHNEYLQMAVELGGGGLLLFLAGVGLWGWQAFALLRGRIGHWERGVTTGLVGAVLGLLTHGAVDSVFHEPALVLLLILCGGIVLVLRSFQEAGRGSSRAIALPSTLGWRILVASCGLVLALIVIQPAAAWYAHERAEAEAEQVDQSLKWLRIASMIDPGVTAYHDAIALVSTQMFHRTGDPLWLSQAADAERIAVELNPIDGRFPYRLGAIYEQLNEQTSTPDQREAFQRQAALAFQQAIRVDPFSPLNYVALARIWLRQGKGVDAVGLLDLAVTYEPNFLPARLALAESYLQAGNLKAARSEYDAAVAIQRKFSQRDLTSLEKQYLNVDLYQLGRALALAEDRP